MISIDFRNITWAGIQAHIVGDRERVLRAWEKHGPCTTRQLAELSDISIFTLRPRTTELVHLGFVEVAGSAGREGIYRALPWHEAQARFYATQRSLREGSQLDLKL